MRFINKMLVEVRNRLPEAVLAHVSLISVFTCSSLAIEVFLLLLTVLDFQMRDKVHNASYHFKTPRCCSCSSSGYMWRLKISTCTDFLSAKSRHVQTVLMFKYLCTVSMSLIMCRSACSWISLRPQASQKHNRSVVSGWKGETVSTKRKCDNTECRLELLMLISGLSAH